MKSIGLMVAEVRFNFMEGDFTVISHSFVTPSTVARMIAVPCFFAVTLPLLLTVATLLFCDFQLTFLPEETLADKTSVCPRYL